MRATFKLLNSYFWKTVYGPIIAFALPVLLLAILGNIMRIQYVYPGIIAMSLMFIGILALPLSVMELKSSSLFKYIGASPVDNKKFSIVAIGYYVFIAIVAACIIMVATMLIFPHDVFPHGLHWFSFKAGILGGIFGTVKGAGSFYVATGLHLFMVIAFGLAIATFAKTPQQALTFAIVIILPSMFLSGMILSVDIIAQSQVMQWISRLIPFRYTTGNIVVASTPIDQLGDIFALLSRSEKSVIFNQNYMDASGVIHYTQGNVYESGKLVVASHEVTIKNVDDLINEINKLDGNYMYMGVGDVVSIKGDEVNGSPIIIEKTLFDLVFVQPSQTGALSGSDNNMFAWAHSWGVRRIPEVEQIKSFITTYFMGADGKGGDASRFASLWEKIKQNDYSWLSLFLKQNNVLYTVADRVLNTAIPVVLSAGSLYYVSKNFKWSSR